MDIIVTPSELKGHISVPVSKSLAHRYLVCLFLQAKKNGHQSFNAQSVLKILNLTNSSNISTDILATAYGLEAIDNSQPVLCHDSGSTARFLVAVAGALGSTAKFYGSPKLKSRPFGPLLDALKSHGCEIEDASGLDILFYVSGKLNPGYYTLPGNISSQFVSSLLMSLSYFDGESVIVVSKPLYSKPYIYLTIRVLELFGARISIDESEDSISYTIVSGISSRQPCILVEGDWSAGAPWLLSNFLGSKISIDNLDSSSLQGDKLIADYLDILSNSSENPISINMSETPDIVPAVAVAAGFRNGYTYLTNIEQLVNKESNRLLATMENLSRCGVFTEQQCEGNNITLIIKGSPNNAPVSHENNGKTLTLASYNDHRIAMCNIVLAATLSNNCRITQVDSLNKSYKGFLDDFVHLGGIYHVV